MYLGNRDGLASSPNLIPWTAEVTSWVAGDQDGLVRDVSSPQPLLVGLRDDLVGRGGSGWARPRRVFPPTSSRGFERWPLVSLESGWTRFFPKPSPIDCRGNLVGRGDQDGLASSPNAVPWTAEVTLCVTGIWMDSSKTSFPPKLFPWDWEMGTCCCNQNLSRRTTIFFLRARTVPCLITASVKACQALGCTMSLPPHKENSVASMPLPSRTLIGRLHHPLLQSWFYLLMHCLRIGPPAHLLSQIRKPRNLHIPWLSQLHYAGGCDYCRLPWCLE
jgi:hypothetical protein